MSDQPTPPAEPIEDRVAAARDNGIRMARAGAYYHNPYLPGTPEATAYQNAYHATPKGVPGMPETQRGEPSGKPVEFVDGVRVRQESNRPDDVHTVLVNPVHAMSDMRSVIPTATDPMAAMLHDAERRGYDDRQAGKGRDETPFAHLGSLVVTLQEAWERGWEQADADIKRQADADERHKQQMDSWNRAEKNIVFPGGETIRGEILQLPNDPAATVQARAALIAFPELLKWSLREGSGSFGDRIAAAVSDSVQAGKWFAEELIKDAVKEDARQRAAFEQAMKANGLTARPK